ncbi:MAG: DUF6198 family protein [Bacillota bacterium]|nr:DUF6198 family protein [Bacillota bacterium]
MNKKRILVYIIGLLVLALGLVLNTKAALGVSPIISVAYCLSEITGISFADMTFLEYTVLVILEVIVHIVDYSKKENAKRPIKNIKKVLVSDVLQIVLSVVFTRFVGLFANLIPDFGQSGYMVRISVLALAIVCTGVGAAMSLDVRIVPNPGDGIVQALADHFGKEVGFTKNCFDLLNVCITTTLGLFIIHRVIGIGIGTLMAVLFVGRVVACFNRFFKKKIEALI